MHNSTVHSNRWNDELSYRQRCILAYAPKPMCLISIMASTWVAVKIVRHESRLKHVYHRLAFAMCISNTINNLFSLWGNWSIPYGTPGNIHASGNVSTCTVTGFFQQLGYVVQFYYVSLSIYVYFALKYEFRAKDIESIEKYLHLGVFIFPVASAIYLASIDMFNSVGMTCWINSSPQGCEKSPYAPCLRGSQKPNKFMAIFGVIPTFTNLVLATIFIIMSILHEKLKHENNGTLRGKKVILEKVRRQKSMLVMKQGALYLGTFYLTSFFRGLVALNLVYNKDVNFRMLLLTAAFTPMSGFLFTMTYVMLLRKQRLNEDNIVREHCPGLRETSFENESSERLAVSEPTPRESYRRQSGTAVSVFDGTDEEKWKFFGVYIGDEREDDQEDSSVEECLPNSEIVENSCKVDQDHSHKNC